MIPDKDTSDLLSNNEFTTFQLKRNTFQLTIAMAGRLTV